MPAIKANKYLKQTTHTEIVKHQRPDAFLVPQFQTNSKYLAGLCIATIRLLTPNKTITIESIRIKPKVNDQNNQAAGSNTEAAPSAEKPADVEQPK